MNVIAGANVPHAYSEAFWKMRVWAVEEQSRNGPVMTSQLPVLLQINCPEQRVLFDPVRDANPFFHVMEFIWFMAGSSDVRWLEYYNKRYREYADDGVDFVHASYGHRWRYHFAVDQITTVAQMLRKDLTTRRAVLGMWDPAADLEPHNDLPCNTQVYFRVVRGALDMTVCNRSNDLVWGMLGANAVHMTMLHELIARTVGVHVGTYRVFTNNLHVYKSLPNFEELWKTSTPYDPYRGGVVEPYALLAPDETLRMFLDDAMLFLYDSGTTFETRWFRNVAVPMREAYRARKAGMKGLEQCWRIAATDWRRACEEWVLRREAAK